MSTAVIVTRRPDWAGHGLRSALRVADRVVYRVHETGTYADALNAALSDASQTSPVCLKVDDHDSYPDDHAAILERWEPGVTVWGMADFVTCDGTRLGRWESLCASAIPTTLTLHPDRSGAVTGSVRAQTRPVTVETGVVKRVCSAEWSWGRRNPTLRCRHG